MSRVADHPIDPLFLDRWSPRSFTGEPLPDSVLATAFEAARWAPSAFNAQPWRFIVARRGEEHWDDFVSLLIPHNRRWAERASALIVITSATLIDRRGVVGPSSSHSFDAGAAWANFAHQALLLGWHAHGIGGFDRQAARDLLAVPDDYAVETMVAVGRRGTLDELHEDFHAQEKPSERRPLTDIVFQGRFGAPAFNNDSRLHKERNAA